jgi:hypothetical protein
MKQLPQAFSVFLGHLADRPDPTGFVIALRHGSSPALAPSGSINCPRVRFLASARKLRGACRRASAGRRHSTWQTYAVGEAGGIPGKAAGPPRARCGPLGSPQDLEDRRQPLRGPRGQHCGGRQYSSARPRRSRSLVQTTRADLLRRFRSRKMQLWALGNAWRGSCSAKPFAVGFTREARAVPRSRASKGARWAAPYCGALPHCE